MNPIIASFLEKLFAVALTAAGPYLNAAGIQIPDIGQTANVIAQAAITAIGLWWVARSHNSAINLGVQAPSNTPSSISGKIQAAAKLVIASAILTLGVVGLTACSVSNTSGSSTLTSTAAATPTSAGIDWSQISARINSALTDIQKGSATAAGSGLVPQGKIGDAVNDTAAVSSGLQTLVQKGYIDPSQVAVAAASFHSDKTTTNIAVLSSIGIDALISLTKDLTAAGATTAQLQTAQSQLIAQTPTAVQSGATTVAPLPAIGTPSSPITPSTNAPTGN